MSIEPRGQPVSGLAAATKEYYRAAVGDTGFRKGMRGRYMAMLVNGGVICR